MAIDLKKKKAFYQNLGKLFYAIAAVDSYISETEIEVLKKTVQNKWQDKDDTSAIINTFDWLREDQEYNAHTCFNSFITFKNANKMMFLETEKQKILNTAIAVASSFSKTNKSELMLLAKLELELQ